MTYMKSSPLITNHSESLGSLLFAYNTTLLSLLDKHAPVIIKLSKPKSKSNPWFFPILSAPSDQLFVVLNISSLETHSPCSILVFQNSS